MANRFAILSPDAPGSRETDRIQFALDVLEGLRMRPRHLASKYFYDEAGSALFQKIMELPEYYLTRAETRIFQAKRQALAARLPGDGFNLVELGPGDGRKTLLLMEAFQEKGLQFTYLPIDISPTALETLFQRLEASLPGLEAKALACDYMTGLRWLAAQSRKQNLVLFLGSNIGNFTPAERRSFLTTLWHALNPGDLVLMGMDLVKNPGRLNAAYNDSQGITREFNLNLLRRINRVFRGNFQVEKFWFYAAFNPRSSAVESYLISTCRQTVDIVDLQARIELEAGEPILTEYSFKFTLPEIERMAAESGFRMLEAFQDDAGDFVDVLWQVEKPA